VLDAICDLRVRWAGFAVFSCSFQWQFPVASLHFAVCRAEFIEHLSAVHSIRTDGGDTAATYRRTAATSTAATTLDGWQRHICRGKLLWGCHCKHAVADTTCLEIRPANISQCKYAHVAYA